MYFKAILQKIISSKRPFRVIISKERKLLYISILTKKIGLKFCKYESVTGLALFVQLFLSEIMNIFIGTGFIFNEQWSHVL